MTSAALRPRRTPENFSQTARTLVALAALVASCAVAVAQPQRVATAKFSGGDCRLRLQSASQETSPENRKKVFVALEFQLEFPEPGKSTFSAQLPPTFYLNNDRSPLVAATAGTTKTIAATAHTGTAVGRQGVVVIRDLDVGAPRDALREVEIELVIVKVVEWDQVKFSGLANDVSDFLACGPFEYRMHGATDHVRLDGWTFPKFRAEQEAYRKRVPLRFLNDDYALEEVKLVDAVGRVPTGNSLSTGGTGASFGTFSSWRRPNAPDAGASATASEEITYPVTLTVQLPKRFTTERVRFRFADIPLPPVR